MGRNPLTGDSRWFESSCKQWFSVVMNVRMTREGLKFPY
jgi:hypothetical protein